MIGEGRRREEREGRGSTYKNRGDVSGIHAYVSFTVDLGNVNSCTAVSRVTLRGARAVSREQ